MIGQKLLPLCALGLGLASATAIDPVRRDGDEWTASLYKSSGKPNLDDFVGMTALYVYPFVSVVFGVARWNISFVESGITKINDTAASFRLYGPDLTASEVVPSFDTYNSSQTASIDPWWIWGYAGGLGKAVLYEGTFGGADKENIIGVALRQMAGRNGTTIVPESADKLWEVLLKSDKQPVYVTMKSDAMNGYSKKATLPVVFTQDDNGERTASLWEITKGKNMLGTVDQIFDGARWVTTFGEDVA